MPFARLMIVWFVALPATTYAFAAATSLAMYPLAASISKQRGAWPVLQAAFALRAAALATLAAAFLSGAGGVQLPLALAGFVVLVIAWPLLGVSGTALAAQLAHVRQYGPLTRWVPRTLASYCWAYCSGSGVKASAGPRCERSSGRRSNGRPRPPSARLRPQTQDS